MLVTREGHIITRHSLTYYAPDSQLHGVLARQREMAQIKIEMDGAEGGISVGDICAGGGSKKVAANWNPLYRVCVSRPGSFSNSTIMRKCRH